MTDQNKFLEQKAIECEKISRAFAQGGNLEMAQKALYLANAWLALMSKEK